jgi:hypothetical protein
MTDEKFVLKPDTRIWCANPTPDVELNFGVFQGQLWGSREVYKIGGMVVAEKQASSDGWPQLTPEFEKLLKQKVKEWVKEDNS